MITCLSDGSMQAFLDGELTVREANAASAHLAECDACALKMSAMKTRAHTVDMMLGVLGEETVETAARIPMMYAVNRRRYGFAASMTTVAALLLIVMLRMVNTPAPPPQQPSEKKQEVAGPVNADVQKPQAVPGQAASSIPRPQVKKNPVPTDDGGFIALNADDPIQIGKIVKMSLPASLFSPNDSMPSNERVMAEVLVGEDGRARAIRLLQSH